MSADIEKLAVYDSRIVQTRPRYAVEKGPLSLTNAPFNAISATSSQLTFNIYVPSENVFVDRKLEWTGVMRLQMQVVVPAAVAGTPIVVPGRDFAVCPFPMNSVCSTLSATINDTTSVINSQDVLKEVLRLADMKRNRQQRTCPTYLDNYQSYDDAYGAPNNPLGGYDSSVDSDNVGNGAYPGLTFTNVAGTSVGGPLGAAANAIAVAPTVGDAYQIVNGVPVSTADKAGPTTYTLYMQLISTEPIVLSPFVFADIHEWDTGLFGINNIQLVMNLQSNISRIIRSTTRTGKAFSLIGFSQGSASPWARAVVNTQFLTPSLSVPLPPKSVIPYMEFPRYITQNGSSQGAGQTLGPGEVGQLQSQTITLPTIPDLLIIYVKAAQSSTTPAFVSTGGVVANNYGDFYLPLASSQTIGGNIVSPLSVNFDVAVMAF